MKKVFKIQFFIIFCCISQLSFGQTLTIPEFPAPENLFYELLQEQKVSYPLSLNGKVKTVTKKFRTFRKDGSINLTETEFTRIDSNAIIIEHYYIYENEKFSDLEVKTPHEMDSINGHKRFRKSNKDDIEEEFWFQNNKLKKYITKQYPYDQWEETFSYDSKGRLKTRLAYTYFIELDENDQPTSAAKSVSAIERVIYKNKLLTNKLFYQRLEENIDRQEIKYTFNSNNKIESYTLKSESYYDEGENLEDPEELKNIAKIEKLNTVINAYRGKFTYDDKGRIKTFTITDTRLKADTESYTITYLPSKMQIDAKINSTKTLENGTSKQNKLTLKYEYTFDKFKNPINIKSYYLFEGTYILDKETDLKIEYYKS